MRRAEKRSLLLLLVVVVLVFLSHRERQQHDFEELQRRRTLRFKPVVRQRWASTENSQAAIVGIADAPAALPSPSHCAFIP